MFDKKKCPKSIPSQPKGDELKKMPSQGHILDPNLSICPSGF